jgi:hypothetical protein
MARRGITRDGNIVLQYGGEEGEALDSMMRTWGKHLYESGQQSAFAWDLANIRPTTATSDEEFRKQLRGIARKAGLPIDGNALDEATPDQWLKIAEHVEEAYEDADWGGDHLVVSDAPEQPDAQQGSWWNDYINPFGAGPRWAAERVAGAIEAQSADVNDLLPAPPPSPAPPPADSSGNTSRARTSRRPDIEPSAQQTSAASQTVNGTVEGLIGASPLEKIKLLEAMQMDPNLQALVKAGLFNWKDVVKKNDGSVSNPDGTVPPEILDEAKLKDLQLQLRTVGLQQQNAQAMQVLQYQRQRTTPGGKPSRGFFGSKKVFMGPQYLPGRLPNEKNVMSIK